MIALPFAYAQSGDFTIVALPDTQYYAASYPSIFNSQTQWIAANAATLNIKAVIGLGDIVNGGGSLTEWQNADTAVKTLEGKVPYFLAIGNHDYNKNDPPNRTASATNFNKYFGPSRYANTHSGWVDSFPSGSNENFAGTLTINGKQYLFLQLEFYPRASAIQWATGMIQAYPNAEVIITTHGYENKDNTRIALCDTYDAEYYNMGTDNDGDEMWANLGSRFPNVSLILSGHIINGSSASAAHQTEAGMSGNLVNEILADYQNITNGGNGYLRIMTFHTSTNQIEVKTYSPTLKAYLTDSSNQFTVAWHATGTTGSGTISGRVKTTGCSAVAGATVSYAGGSTTTDSSGNFKLSNVPSGIQNVTVKSSGYGSISKLIPVGAGLTANPLYFLTASTGSITGKLTDSKTGAAIAAASVSSNGSSTTTDSTGTYKFTGISASSVQVTASADKYGSLTQQVSITSGATATLNMLLSATNVPTTGSITGTVTNATNGAAVTGASVSYSGGSTTTDANGAYTLRAVPVGPIVVTYSAAGMQSAIKTVSVVGGQTATQNIALTPIPVGSITGTVTDSYTGAPIAGATLSYPGGSNTTTDATGTYTLNNVPAGNVVLTASAANYQSQSNTISLAQNQSFRQDFVLTAAATGNISGVISNALTGVPILGASVTSKNVSTLTDASGKYLLSNIPARSATVTATASGYLNANNSATVTVSTGQTVPANIQLAPIATTGSISGVVTDASTNAYVVGATVSCGGITAITGDDGTYTLTNVPSGTQIETVSATGYVTAGKTVTVVAGQTIAQDFTIAPTPAPAGNTGALTGTVTDAISKQPLIGAAVSSELASTTTDSAGSYTLPTLTSGGHTISVSMAGYVAGSINVAITAGATTTKNMSLSAAPVTGALTGSVTDAVTGNALAGAYVTFSGGNATTDANGNYTLSNVPVGDVSVSASATGYAGAAQTASIVAGMTQAADFMLNPNPATGTITGTVSDTSSSPITGSTVWYAGGSAVTDANGAFSLSGVPVGTQVITASVHGYADASATMTVNSSGATQALTQTPEADVPAVTGIVQNASGSPISGAMVAYGDLVALTQSDGTYTLQNVSAGAQTFKVSALGYSDMTQSVNISLDAAAAGQSVAQDFTLTAAPNSGTLSGRVLDSRTNAPLPGATVSYPNGTAITDANGAYSLSNVPVGTQSISVSLSGYASSTQNLSVTANRTTSHTFTLSPNTTTGSINGVVTNANTGAGISGATVSYGGGSAITDASGTYVLSDVAAGPQTISVAVTSFNTASQATTVTAGQTVNLNVALTPTATTGAIAGKVTDGATGAAINGAVVTYSGGRATTDSGGNYSFAKVATGAQMLTVTAAGYANTSQAVNVTPGQTTTQNFGLKANPTTGTVSGKVTDAGSGAALTGATVTAGTSSAVTDATGTYTLSQIVAGTISLSVSKTGYNSSSASVAIVAGQSATQNFALTAVPTTGSVTGKITNGSTGAAVSGATVSCAGKTAASDATGTYTIASVTAGAQTLTVSAVSYATISSAVTVTAGQSVIKNVALTPTATTGTIIGKITNASTGAALSGVTVTSGGITATSDTSGTYQLSAVPTGTASVVATKSGWGTQTKTVSVTAGATSTLNFGLATSGKIAVTVKNSAGAAVSGAAVSIKGGAVATTVTGTTSSTGAYTTSWIPIGSYTVTVSQSGHTTQSKTVSVASGATASLSFTNF